VVDLVVTIVVVVVEVVVVVVVVVIVVVIGSTVGEKMTEVDPTSVEDFIEVFISSMGSSSFVSSCCCSCFLSFVLEMSPLSLLRFSVPVGRNLRGPVPTASCSFMNFSNSAFNGEFSPRAAIISSSSLSSSSWSCGLRRLGGRNRGLGLGRRKPLRRRPGLPISLSSSSTRFSSTSKLASVVEVVVVCLRRVLGLLKMLLARRPSGLKRLPPLSLFLPLVTASMRLPGVVELGSSDKIAATMFFSISLSECSSSARPESKGPSLGITLVSSSLSSPVKSSWIKPAG